MRINLFWRVLPVHILVGSLLLLPFWQRHEAAAQALRAGNIAQSKLVEPTNVPQAMELEGVPVRIILPRLAIDVSVVPGIYNMSQKEWSVAPDSANYAPNTAKANNVQDLTLIYGHWTPKIFGPTKQIVSGDIAYVYTDNNHVFKYIFIGNTLVKPTDVQIFDQLKGEPGLVLMTCEGTWAQNRRLMTFKLDTAQ